MNRPRSRHSECAAGGRYGALETVLVPFAEPDQVEPQRHEDPGGADDRWPAQRRVEGGAEHDPPLAGDKKESERTAAHAWAAPHRD